MYSYVVPNSSASFSAVSRLIPPVCFCFWKPLIETSALAFIVRAVNTQSKSGQRRGDRKVSIQLWVPLDLRESYREAVARDERNVAQAIRRHMQETVAEAERSEVAA
jgi:hypothetical protein